jgi:hypothetical protein
MNSLNSKWDKLENQLVAGSQADIFVLRHQPMALILSKSYPAWRRRSENWVPQKDPQEKFHRKCWHS